MTLTEILETWVKGAERMHGGGASGVVVTRELFKPSESTFPLGYDPAMPVVFVPLPPNAVEDPAALEMYNRLRWIGLGPEEALAGAGR